MVDVVPTLPAEYAHAGEVFNNRLGDRRPGRIFGLIAGFVALGFGAEGLFWLATKRLRRHLEALPVETVGERLRLIAERALLHWVWWWPMPLAASAPFCSSAGPDCCARSCSAI